MPKMHQNTFGGRELMCYPKPLAAMGAVLLGREGGWEETYF